MTKCTRATKILPSRRMWTHGSRRSSSIHDAAFARWITKRTVFFEIYLRASNDLFYAVSCRFSQRVSRRFSRCFGYLVLHRTSRQCLTWKSVNLDASDDCEFRTFSNSSSTQISQLNSPPQSAVCLQHMERNLVRLELATRQPEGRYQAETLLKCHNPNHNGQYL